MQRWKHPLFAVILLLIVLVPHTMVALRADGLLDWFNNDDAYYYFKVAQNIAAGRGITFDGINPANGFHPLWELLCIPVFALARFSLTLPLRALVILLAFLNAATGFMLFHLLRRLVSFEVAALGSLLWVLLPRIHSVTTMMGMEASISALSTVALLYFVVRYRENPTFSGALWAGISAAFVLYSRLDNFFLVGVLGLWVVFHRLKLAPQIVLGLVLAVLTPLLAYLLRIELGHTPYAFSRPAYTMSLLALIIRVPLNFLFGLYRAGAELAWKRALRTALAVSTGSILLGAAMVSLNRLAFFPMGWPRSTLLIEWALSLLLSTAWQILVLKTAAGPPEGLSSLWRWLRSNLNELWAMGFRYYGVIAGALAVYLLFNLVYFDTLMPVSGQIKQWWGGLPNTVYGYRDSLTIFLGLSSKPNLGPWNLAVNSFLDASRFLQSMFQPGADVPVLSVAVAVPFLLLIFLPLALERRSSVADFASLLILPLLVACFIQFAYYKAGGYLHTRSWYWIPQMLCLTLCAVVWLQSLFRLFQRLRTPVLSSATVLIAGLLLLNANLDALNLFTPQPDQPKPNAALLDIARLEQHTPPGALIGQTGGGVVSYFIEDRTIVNLDGLMNSPRYFRLLQACQAAQLLDDIGLQYIYANRYMLTESDPYRCNFAGRVEHLGAIGELDLFEYLPGR